MRAVLQRVQRGDVTVRGQTVGKIDSGLVVLIGVTHEDSTAHAQQLAYKCANLRIFEDEGGKMNLSALDIGADVLVISQFTLYADCKRGRRPSFTRASPPELARPLIEHFVAGLRKMGISRVETGAFGEHMMVGICNDGPVTIILDTNEL